MKTFAKVLGFLFGALILMTAAIAASLYWGAVHLDPAPLISIDGEDFGLAGLDMGHSLVAAAILMVVLLVVFTVVPLALLGVAGVVFGALAIAAFAVGGVALLVLSPLILTGLVVWWLVRLARRTTISA